jgi:hypothetical protein
VALSGIRPIEVFMTSIVQVSCCALFAVCVDDDGGMLFFSAYGLQRRLSVVVSVFVNEIEYWGSISLSRARPF